MLTKQYTTTLNLIKEEISFARIKVAKAITKGHIDLYFKIGKIILEKQEKEKWGKSIVEQISKDLQKDYPNSTGYSARNLWDMRRCYERYSNKPILRQLVAEVEYALRVPNKPIGIAEYQLTKELPKELKKYLPSNNIIKNKLTK